MIKFKSFILVFFTSFISFTLSAQTSALLYNDAVALMKQGKFTEAITIYNKIIEKTPYYYEAYADRGFCNFNLGKKADALKDFNISVTKNKDY